MCLQGGYSLLSGKLTRSLKAFFFLLNRDEKGDSLEVECIIRLKERKLGGIISVKNPKLTNFNLLRFKKKKKQQFVYCGSSFCYISNLETLPSTGKYKIKNFVLIYLLCESLYSYSWSLFKSTNFLFINPIAYPIWTLSFYPSKTSS